MTTLQDLYTSYDRRVPMQMRPTDTGWHCLPWNPASELKRQLQFKLSFGQLRSVIKMSYWVKLNVIEIEQRRRKNVGFDSPLTTFVRVHFYSWQSRFEFVAHSVRSLSPLTHFPTIHSLHSRARSLTLLTLSFDNKNSRICVHAENTFFGNVPDCCRQQKHALIDVVTRRAECLAIKSLKKARASLINIVDATRTGGGRGG